MAKRKRKANKLNIYLGINSILLAWLALTTIIILGKYDILPFKYYIWILISLLILPGTIIFFMMRKKTKSIIKKILSGLSIILIIILSVALAYLNKTFRFLDKLGESGYMIENYSVIVLNNNKYNDIKDLENKSIGYNNQEGSNIEEALTKLDEQISSKKKEISDYNELVTTLYNEENDAIIIEESYKGIIEETNENFEKDTKVIYTIEVKKKTESIVKNVDVKKETFNIYITGIDTYGDISSVSRSDVNIIATVNPDTHQVLLTTIPRDYYVQLDGTTGLKDKLTHAGIYGVEKSIKTLENLLEIEINYYVKVNFSSVERIIEALGGVEVYSEYTFQGASGTYFQRGYNYVNGKTALEFARTRKTVEGGDRTRGKNQQALIQAMLNKICSKEIITKYSSILNSLEGTFQTNMSTDKITDILKKQIDEMKPWNVTSISLDGSNGSEYTYSMPGQLLYVMIPDESTIENAKEKIKQVTDGIILDASYEENNGYVNNSTIARPVESKPKEEKPVEQIPAEQKPEEQKPVEKTPTEIKPKEEKIEKTNETKKEQEVTIPEPVIEQKPVEKTPTEIKPKEEKIETPDETKTETTVKEKKEESKEEKVESSDETETKKETEKSQS